MHKQAKKGASKKPHQTTKDMLRKKLITLNVPFTEKDGVEILTKKVLQAQLPAKRDEHRQFALFDECDDQQILAEIKGELVDKYVYRFEQDGKDITGLSKTGVAEACRERANRYREVYRAIEAPIINDEGEFVRVMVKIGRFAINLDNKGRVIAEVLLDTTYGSKRQWKKFKRRDWKDQRGGWHKGEIADDPFYFEKAVSKAERNGKSALLPLEFKLKMIKKYLSEKDRPHVQDLGTKNTTKISAEQLKYLHGLTPHDVLEKIVTEKYGYTSLNEIESVQVSEIAAEIRARASARAKLPIDLIGACNAKGILPAKREAMWQKALQVAGGDVVKATAFMRQEIERARAEDGA
jgi:hypothetical protein